MISHNFYSPHVLMMDLLGFINLSLNFETMYVICFFISIQNFLSISFRHKTRPYMLYWLVACLSKCIILA